MLLMNGDSKGKPVRKLYNVGRLDGVRPGRCGDHGPLRRFTLNLPIQTFSCLEKMSEEAGRPVSSLIRAILNHKLKLNSDSET